MASSLNMKKSGQFIAKGADKKIVLGFKPMHVKIFNVTDGIKSEKTASMPSAKAVSEDAAGAATYADHIVMESDGFTVKAALAVNTKELHYIASEAKNELA